MDLPTQLAAAYAHDRKQVHTLHAGQQEETVDRWLSILVTMWTSLARYYPPSHFEANDLEAFSQTISLVDKPGGHCWCMRAGLTRCDR
jgi:hypothetical protein